MRVAFSPPSQRFRLPFDRQPRPSAGNPVLIGEAHHDRDAPRLKLLVARATILEARDC